MTSDELDRPRVFLNSSTSAAPTRTLTGRDPRAFHRRLPGYVSTPLVNAPAIAARLGIGALWVKDESSRFGLPAYKILGASWAVYRALEQHAARSPDQQLEPWSTVEELRERLRPLLPLTLACATDGNHGRAVARMARLLDLQAHILVPSDMAPARVAAIAAEGAAVTAVAGGYDYAIRQCALLAGERCLVISDTAWEGYEDVPRWVMEGYGTLYKEVDEALAARGEAPPDVIAVQIGVGALAASVVWHYCGSGARIIGVEPSGAACLLASLEAGRAVSLDGDLCTVMAGLRCGTSSPLAWPALRAGLATLVAIPDERARQAMRLLARAGIEAGESGAAGLGGMLELCTGSHAEEHRAALGITECSRVLVLNTEGATDRAAYEQIVNSSQGKESAARTR